MTDIDMERLEYFRDRHHALVVIDYKVADDNHTGSLLSLDDVIKRLNKVTVENEQLKQQINDEKHLNKLELQELKDQIKTLAAQLYCTNEEGVCSICKHHYLVQTDEYRNFFISKCRKKHEECSKKSLKHCKDFKVIGADE